jgi:uncharacterized protein
MNERFPQYFWGMLTLAIALVIGGIAIGGGLSKIRGSANIITVTGSAKKPVHSDFALWRASVSSQKADMQSAFRDVKSYTERLRNFLKEKAVPDSAVTFNSLENENIEEWHNGSRTGKILAYRITQRFEVRSNRVESIGKLIDEVTNLINDGIPVESTPVQYLFTKLPEMRVDMMAEATKDAKLRAQKIAESAGAKIGPIRSARMGVFQLTPRNSTEISDYGMNDVTALEKDLTAVVSLSFAVE